MILVRSPLRVSFIGGGTDTPSYYQQGIVGHVFAAAIGLHVYCAVSEYWRQRWYHIAYSNVETVDQWQEIRHDLLREALAREGLIDGGIEIHTMADVPGKGTGLGSSAAVTCAALLALSAHKGTANEDPRSLAEGACIVEIGKLKRHGGKQDQYAVALGGFQEMWFNPNGTVVTEQARLSPKAQAMCDGWLRLYHTGLQRDAESVLLAQHEALQFPKARKAMEKAAARTGEVRLAIEDARVEDLAGMLDDAWVAKREYAPGITTIEIDGMYERALRAGALGGKLLGAGGGGYMLLVVPPEKQDAVDRAVRRPGIATKWGVRGAHVVYDDRGPEWLKAPRTS